MVKDIRCKEQINNLHDFLQVTGIGRQLLKALEMGF